MPPSIPSPLTLVADPDLPTVHLSWPASTDYGTPTSGLRGYTVERSLNGTTGWTILQSGLEDITYNDTSTTWSTQYWYRVKAVDLSGNSSDYALSGPVMTRPHRLPQHHREEPELRSCLRLGPGCRHFAVVHHGRVGSTSRPSGEKVKSGGT